MADASGATAVRRRRLDLSWLRPPKPDDEGSMALVDHLRELRYRVIVSVIAILVAFGICWNWNQFLYRQVFRPYNQAIAWYVQAHPDGSVDLVTDGIAGALMLVLKTCLYAGIIASCPVWLYQLWAFIAPGLLAKEKKYALAFMGSAIPLFLSGVALAYWIAPKGFAVLLGFTPDDVTNLQDVSKFLQFLTIMLLVFGLSFLLPVVLVALNLMGVVRARTLSRFRIPAIFICFVFGAVATPSVDPFSMLAMAIPMALMYIISEVICHANDRRRGITADGDIDAELVSVD
ncbi:twin-arginine translocase subunit TatC [Luteococcus sanguinis]|uniref:Sec-independent protein translocase protein TatC n=1 Tax=Luteococcus sanguinis TaxID=174038 RepID=A0ABW1X1E6_9ACTN